MAKFITIEGQDGAGKTTNIDVIRNVLLANDIEFIQTREPGGTKLGEHLRELLLGTKDKSICDLSELLIIFAARAQHLNEVIVPALEQGKWVLCDRFTDATYAYQGARGLSEQLIAQLEQMVQHDLRPDLTLVLDVPIEVGLQRAGERSEPDRFEQEDIDYKDKVRQGYLKRVVAMPERMKVIDASQGIDAVAEQIKASIQAFIMMTYDHRGEG